MKRMILAGILAAGTASAEPLIGINDLIAQIDGSEVSVSGRLGARTENDGILLTEDGRYRVRYALTRDQLASIEGCEFNSQSQGCPVRISAEVDVEDGLINLIAFDIALLPD